MDNDRGAELEASELLFVAERTWDIEEIRDANQGQYQRLG